MHAQTRTHTCLHTHAHAHTRNSCISSYSTEHPKKHVLPRAFCVLSGCIDLSHAQLTQQPYLQVKQAPWRPPSRTSQAFVQTASWSRTAMCLDWAKVKDVIEQVKDMTEQVMDVPGLSKSEGETITGWAWTMEVMLLLCWGLRMKGTAPWQPHSPNHHWSTDGSLRKWKKLLLDVLNMVMSVWGLCAVKGKCLAQSKKHFGK